MLAQVGGARPGEVKSAGYARNTVVGQHVGQCLSQDCRLCEEVLAQPNVRNGVMSNLCGDALSVQVKGGSLVGDVNKQGPWKSARAS